MARGLYHGPVSGHVLRFVAYLITNRILRILPPMHCDPDYGHLSRHEVGQQDLLSAMHAWLAGRSAFFVSFFFLFSLPAVTGSDRPAN
jgi:hypothetical protein